MSTPKLTYCIVTYQTKDYLRQCLDSIRRCDFQFTYEIVIVDNASSDGTVGMIREEYPEVTFIENNQNLGYTKPMNQALQASHGQYLVQLNPDTLIIEGSFQKLVGYMDSNPQVGICGPKVLNRDGSFQSPCRRGEPRPLAVLGYFFKLGKLFPKNRALNEYLLSYLDVDEINLVAAVSGSCMVIRREVVDQIGYLDELFFCLPGRYGLLSQSQASWLECSLLS
jgi:GT2 family glycosyltransferase